jgi:hypothetical protein
MVPMYEIQRSVEDIENVFQVVVRQITATKDQINIWEHPADMFTIDPVYNLIAEEQDLDLFVFSHNSSRVPRKRRYW